jgi:dihydropteroate synthase
LAEKPFEINCAGRILSLKEPVVMGILNLTPDSFYDGGSFTKPADQLKQAEQMISEGASVIDIGAISTRPGAELPGEKEELERLLPCLTSLSKHFPDILISVDTFRSTVAKAAIGHGASMINDVFGGRFDDKMFELVAGQNIPYVMMHMQGAPGNMQVNPHYTDLLGEIHAFFRSRLEQMPDGFTQVILDPGFGFGKTVEHNYRLLRHLDTFTHYGYPLLAGLSRKSMITRLLGVPPQEALNGTSVLNTVALLKGANILRVHDVKEAIEAIRLVKAVER